MVVGNTFELARYAASILEIAYEVAAHQTELTNQIDRAYQPGKGKAGFQPPNSCGNFGRGWQENVAHM